MMSELPEWIENALQLDAEHVIKSDDCGGMPHAELAELVRRQRQVISIYAQGFITVTQSLAELRKQNEQLNRFLKQALASLNRLMDGEQEGV